MLAGVWAVVAGLGLIAIVRVVAFDRVHVFMLADSYTLWLYLPAYGIAVSAICFRSRALVLAAGLLIAAQLVWVLPPVFRTVSIPAAARSAPRLRVVSANLNFQNRDYAPDLADFARDDADVIVLEEVTPDWWSAIEGSGLLTSHPHYAESLRWDSGGLAILSRLPLTDVVVHPDVGWPIITATVSVDHQAVHLEAVHLVAPLDTFDRNQRQQRTITGIIRGLARPRLIAGDFNASPYNRWYGQILGLGLREADEAVGRPWATTWPNGQHLLPSLRLDHFFVDPSLIPLHTAEGRGKGSDHRPIIVDLAVMPAKN
jgi:endonuclease/exonuclease/phosphatase (EEP) superfamily protein YafD